MLHLQEIICNVHLKIKIMVHKETQVEIYLYQSIIVTMPPHYVPTFPEFIFVITMFFQMLIQTCQTRELQGVQVHILHCSIAVGKDVAQVMFCHLSVCPEGLRLTACWDPPAADMTLWAGIPCSRHPLTTTHPQHSPLDSYYCRQLTWYCYTLFFLDWFSSCSHLLSVCIRLEQWNLLTLLVPGNSGQIKWTSKKTTKNTNTLPGISLFTCITVMHKSNFKCLCQFSILD